MSISMEVPVSKSFQSFVVSRFCFSSNVSLCLCRKKLNCHHRSLRIQVSSEKKHNDASFSFKAEGRTDGFNLWGRQSEDSIDVISIGSRKDAIVDFCLVSSPFQFSSSLLRFWSIQTKDSTNIRLQEKLLEKDLNPRVMEASQFLKFCSKAVILVASAGYGLDDITAIDILKTARSRNGFTIAIILKPFSFEGQRRQDEVEELVGKLQAYTNFCIDVDTDALLKKDLVTLDEALKSANSAVLLAINAISILISEMHQKIVDGLHNNVKELKVSEVIKILESYKEAKIGFGAGNSINCSITQALCDCPFIGAGVEGINGIAICIVASSDVMDNKDVHTSLLAFRQTANYMGEIIICTAHEPYLEPNIILTTVVIVGCIEQQASQKSSMLSRLAQHFSFVFKLLRIPRQQLTGDRGNSVMEDALPSKVIVSPGFGPLENSCSAKALADGVEKHSEELDRVLTSDYNDVYSPRNYSSGVEEDEDGLFEATIESSSFYHQNIKGTPAFQREPLISRNLGPGYQIAQEWAKERAGATPVLDVSMFQLPVGVRPSEELKGSLNNSYATDLSEPKTGDDFKGQTFGDSSIPSWGALSDAGFVAVRDFCNNASTLLKGRNGDAPKKQGILSARAESMLEAERDLPKKWTPTMEMQYRGGVYRGKCQGGLPEGKGRLILVDGSMYDGSWRYGKRSGPGTFYFSNGDVFQGSWRDDLMHGKGWFYFHTGDRWFANFWKGKANGESRFYSKSGDVSFGHFLDGWRHGHFLCIDVDGMRFVEMWNEGFLVSREQVDPNNGGG